MGSLFSFLKSLFNYSRRNLPVNSYDTFEMHRHIQPVINENEFAEAKHWDLGWLVLEPINIATFETEKEVAVGFSPGQKMLYFFWYLDGQVTNGGFIQFYCNGYRRYVPAIIEGLKLIDDTKMIELVRKADEKYVANKKDFTIAQNTGDLSSLYEGIKGFSDYDTLYYKLHNDTMSRIEDYIRANHEQFLKFG